MSKELEVHVVGVVRLNVLRAAIRAELGLFTPTLVKLSNGRTVIL